MIRIRYGDRVFSSRRALARWLAAITGRPAATIRILLGQYGDDVDRVLEIVKAPRSPRRSRLPQYPVEFHNHSFANRTALADYLASILRLTPKHIWLLLARFDDDPQRTVRLSKPPCCARGGVRSRKRSRSRRRSLIDHSAARRRRWPDRIDEPTPASVRSRRAPIGCMTKAELIAELAASNPHLRQADVELVVTTIFEQIIRALAHGQRVELRGFGAFTVKQRNARIGRDPRTGEEVPVGKKLVPFFRAGRELHQRVDDLSAARVHKFG